MGGIEASSRRDTIDWRAQFRIGSATTWSECRVLDVTLTGARIELSAEVRCAVAIGESCSVQIDSIADDDVGIVIQAVVVGEEPGPVGRPIVDVEFRAGREERILLHLLVRLHTLV